MPLTYAERVKRQGVWNFQIPPDYSKDREVSFKLANHSKRSEIYEILSKAHVKYDVIEGIIQKPVRVVELTCRSKEAAIKTAENLKNRNEVSNVIAHGDAYVKLTVGWVPIDFPEKALDDALKCVGIINFAVTARDRIAGKKDGRRIYTVKRQTLLEVKPPSYIYFGLQRFIVEYTGQEQTCSYCSEAGHINKDCPYREFPEQEFYSSTSSEGMTLNKQANIFSGP